MTRPATRVLVIGCGGIGGVVTGHLAELGVEVHAVSRNPAVIEAITANGLRLTGEGGDRSVPVAVHPEVPAGPFDFILLATQPLDVEEAARQAQPALGPDGRIVCFQNGLCEERVAAVLGDRSRVVGGIVAWGASMVAPGVYDRTADGGFVLGRLDGEADPRVDALADLLEVIGPVQRTSNLAGARWSKLALNCAVSSLGTLNGSTLGKVVRQRFARRIALEIMTEVVRVAQRLEVKLEKVSGTLDLTRIALDDQPRPGLSLAGKHALILAVGLRYRRMRSSMLRAIEAGRAPGVEFLNGEVARFGERLGVPTPVNQQVTLLVQGMARGEVTPGRAVIESLRSVVQGN
ncbi:MAG: 2-dehydropantoate 2-reductase [Myxococcales bacterium]|nr:2-dehydropantoate 2-reductase [Myxococcales bacterium]